MHLRNGDQRGLRTASGFPQRVTRKLIPPQFGRRQETSSFMSSILVIIAVALLAAWGYQNRTRRQSAQTPARKSTQPAQPFAGVRIRVGPRACEPAQAIVDKHFLVKEAPRLPLRDCKAPRCQCSFEKLSDRRAESRRWADEGLGAVVFSAAERRGVPDRRDRD
jgi:Tfp pilus assembly protein PilV